MLDFKDEPQKDQASLLFEVSGANISTSQILAPPDPLQCEPPSASDQLFIMQQFEQHNVGPYSMQLMQPIDNVTVAPSFKFHDPITESGNESPALHGLVSPQVDGPKNPQTTPQAPVGTERPPTPPNPADVNGEFVVPSVIPEFFVTETLRGNKAVVYKYFLYFCEDGKKNQKYHHFRCNAPGCKARLTTNGWETVRASSGEHHHPAPNDLPERMIRQFIKRKVVSSNESSSSVVANALKNCPPALFSTMPTQSKLVKLAQVERKRKGSKPTDPKTYMELDLDEKLKFTEKGEMFLLHDDGKGNEDRIVCFATRANLNQLIYCKTWIADASSPSCPRIYSRLFVIFGVVNQQALPLCYFLLPDSTSKSYARALRILKMAEPEAFPHTVMIDYDEIQKSAFQEVYAPTFQSCFFYFRQAIMKSISLFPGLKTFIQQDMTNWNRMKVGRFVALSLLRQEDVLTGYRLLLEDTFSQQHMAVLQPLFEYFHSRWIPEANENMKNPIPPPISWNFFLDSLKGGLKVTASMDTWHSSFFRYMKGSGPMFGAFFAGLKLQQSKVEDIFADMSSLADPQKKRRLTADWVQMAEDQIIKQYPSESLLQHLEQVAMALNLQL